MKTALLQNLLFVLALATTVKAQPPIRLYNAPNAPKFTLLNAGQSPPLNAYDNFVIGPDYIPAKENKRNPKVPHGSVSQFTIDSKETRIFNPGIARDEFGIVDPNNPNTLIVETREIDYRRQITVYLPPNHDHTTTYPFMVVHDGPKGKPNPLLPNILDNLIAEKRIPAMVMIQIANGGGDAQGHQRGREYDNMSGLFAEYIETEVLPRVASNYSVRLTKDPNGRAAMGSSSGGSASLIMAWFRTDLYRRVLTTSGTFVNQAWPYDPAYPGGAWEFHRSLIPGKPKKPIRIFISVGDRDLLNPNVMRDGMHDWVEANHRMAKVLEDAGYEYQYLFCRNSKHGIRNAKEQFLPHAIEWVWDGYGTRAIK